MKKLATLLLLSTVALVGCTSIQRGLRGDEYVDSSISAEESSKAAAQAAKDLNDALAVENFLTHAKEGYYNGITFHRVIDGFMVQTGDPKGDGTGGQSIWHDKDKTKDKGTGFKNEISPYLYNIRGALAMANTGQPNTNGSQFFINQNSTDISAKLPTSKYPKKIIEAYKEGGNPSLDGKHPVFGQVIDGMDIVDKIAKAEKDEKDKPTSAITIDSIEVVKDYDFSKK